MKCLLGKKLGMSTIYDGEKGAQNVTLLSCAPNTVGMIRTQDRDGYEAVALEYARSTRKNVRKEFRLDSEALATFEVGKEISVAIFEVGDRVKVSSTSKAKGFQGVVKRHGFSGSPKTHGHKHDLRAPGSIGSAYPQHVLKGVRMAGRMGGDTITTSGLRVALVDAKKQILAVKGAVPGSVGSLVSIVCEK